jgi:hypothetical protein
VRQYVQVTATTLVGVSAEGKLLWRYDRVSNTHRINCSTPVYHDGIVFAASSYDAGGGVVKLSKDDKGEIKAAEATGIPVPDPAQEKFNSCLVAPACFQKIAQHLLPPQGVPARFRCINAGDLGTHCRPRTPASLSLLPGKIDYAPGTQNGLRRRDCYGVTKLLTCPSLTIASSSLR